MPDRTNELTAAQVHLAGELLMPRFREAVREETADLRADVAEMKVQLSARSRGMHVVNTVLTFIGTVFSGQVLDAIKGK